MNVTDLEQEVAQIKQYLSTQQPTHESNDVWIQSLQQENHELKMYLATLVRLLVSKNILSQQDLTRFVHLVDSPDAQG